MAVKNTHLDNKLINTLFHDVKSTSVNDIMTSTKVIQGHQ